MSARAAFWVRFILAGPVAVLLTVLVVAAGPRWLPVGRGGVDHIVFPILLTPAIWAVLFFYALLDRSLLRAGAVMAAVAVVNLALLWGVLWR